ncbi:MAG TPA: CADD family putative folate metabolism protein [Candidatus Acidoferrales bacterium]|nr:CADD family putative folate metabolism protein [Candidatus Acidoferrales bacterium]
MLLDAIDRKIEEHHLLKSPFYKAWTEGTLPKESLRQYAAQYFQHVAAFPGYLQALEERADGSLRPLVQDNLAEELDPAGPHPQLWRDFAAAAGADGRALDTAEPMPAVKALIETYRDLCTNGSPAEAVAALYAYEAQVPEIATQKIAGLKLHYGVTEAPALRYFAVHEEADVRHRAAWREWLASQDAAETGKAAAAAERALKALWNALEAMYSRPCN